MKHLKESVHRKFEAHRTAMRAGVIALGREPVAQKLDYVFGAERHAVFDGALTGNGFCRLELEIGIVCGGNIVAVRGLRQTSATIGAH